jgi:hypothetical protein
LGYADPDVMLEEMSSRTWARWQVWRSKGLFPSERLELMLAQVCAVLANTNRWGKQKGRAARMDDFLLPTLGRHRPDGGRLSDPREMRERLQAYTRRVGGVAGGKKEGG